MTYAKKRGVRNEESALNSLLFLRLNGPDDALLDSIEAAKSWRVFEGRNRPQATAPLTEYVTEAVDATTGDEIELDASIHETLDEFDQLGFEPDMVAQDPLFFLDEVEETVYTANLERTDSQAVAATSAVEESEADPPRHLGPSRIPKDWVPKNVFQRG